MFRYAVEYWDSDKCDSFIEKGLVSGSDYASAAGKLEEFYGDELCSIEKLYLLEDIILDNEMGVFAND